MITSSPILRCYCCSSDKLFSPKHWLQIFSTRFSSNIFVGQINMLIIMIFMHGNFIVFLETNSQNYIVWTSLLIPTQYKNVGSLVHLTVNDLFGPLKFLFFFFFYRFYLFIHERHKERGRDIRRGRTRTQSPTRDHDLSQMPILTYSLSHPGAPQISKFKSLYSSCHLLPALCSEI